MTSSVVRARLAATVSLVALSLATPALAQSAQEQAATVDDIIVTAQKREESIQSVPIAVSAFSAETLDAMKIEGGSELLRAIPNVAFSKNNFSMFNFSIRGVGTKAISAASDPAVAISFNNAPMIRNRLFESEYLDVSRVEVLRGPQGTLYGRNATAGVVNMLPNLPGADFDALLKAEVGNYGSKRGQLMINIPLSDSFWFRAAASITDREGYDYNAFNDTKINARDLHSSRLSAAWEPSERLSANFIWEHFGEKDNRSRTGKQLCTTDKGPETVGGVAVVDNEIRGRMSQGCLPGSLYDDAAYGVPNGSALSQIFLAGSIGPRNSYTTPTAATRTVFTFVNGKVDPYAGITQSRNLREISTEHDPVFEAKNDIFQLNVKYDISDIMRLHSQTTFTSDSYYSSQDYNRYISNPIFNDSAKVYNRAGGLNPSETTAGGMYNDPQLGRSSRMSSVDLSKSENDQFTQEFRLESSMDGKFNFSLGANYLKFKTADDYYVFNNLFSFLAEVFYNGAPYDYAKTQCVSGANYECMYVDQNALRKIDGDGHNYFRSKNEVTTESWAAFGEAYIDFTESVSATLGLRYTNDTKTTTPYPSQLLLGTWELIGVGPSSGGNVSAGLPADPEVKQEWNALTGRAVLQWTFGDGKMMYGAYARGYKGGGTNPPRADINPAIIQYSPLPSSFEPEYVNSFEIGLKGRYFDNRVRVNATAFYYDYDDYQVSQIVDRISLNENFDAQIFGAEFEGFWQITPSFRIDGNLGLLKTRIKDGEASIDIMNRTQGNEDWMVLRPWLQVPSNCIAPRIHVEKIIQAGGSGMWQPLTALCGGSARSGSFTPEIPSSFRYDLIYGFTYNPFTDAPNNGKGFTADLGGNELPNAPKWTLNIGAQYEWNVSNWEVVARADYYKQGNSFFRVYNTEYDQIRSWDNANISVSFNRVRSGLSIGLYVKNVFDNSDIVDAFTNSDDSLLTTNVFVTDPRLIGFNVTKKY